MPDRWGGLTICTLAILIWFLMTGCSAFMVINLLAIGLRHLILGASPEPLPIIPNGSPASVRMRLTSTERARSLKADAG
jgi:hypothetical protein